MPYKDLEVRRQYQKEYQAIYKKVNAEHLMELARIWRDANREHNRERNRAYNAAHKAERATTEHRRRARKYGAESDDHTRAEIFERDNGKCQICGVILDPNNWHEDHIIPLALKGSNLRSNVQATCPHCNHVKNRFVGRNPAGSTTRL